MRFLLVLVALSLSPWCYGQARMSTPGIDDFSVALVGRVRSGDMPLPLARVTLYIAGAEKGTGNQAIGSATADLQGVFVLRFAARNNRGAVYYAIAESPNPAIKLATVLGTQPFDQIVTINERTTIAAVTAMAQYINGVSIGGKGPGLQNASLMVRNLVDPRTGGMGAVLGSSPNGTDSSSMALFNSLCNALAGAVRGITTPAYFLIATPPGGPMPTNTLQAASNIAHASWRRPAALYAASQAVEVYTPALSAAPVTWAVSLKFVGNGHEFDGPGAPAFDQHGNLWINNNYPYRRDHSQPTCGGRLLSKLTPTGQDFPGAPYDGTAGGLDGAGFGIALDPIGRVWLGNFGFFGSTCPCLLAPPADSISLFSASGQALSPPGGFKQGCIRGPQATVSDQGGSIWIANTCGGSVTRYAHGDPNVNWVYDIAGNDLAPVDDCPMDATVKPFGIAVDAAGNGWVSVNRNDEAILLSPSGQLLARSALNAGITAPMGIAIDSVGDVWISNSGIVNVPCVTCGDSSDALYGPLVPDLNTASITKLAPDGTFLGNYKGGGIAIPWGIAVDGDDNVWVANFGQQKVAAFRGDTGEAIAPDGFHSDALVRNTAVTIDPSGNVWLANNWLLQPPQTNPGGDGMVVFLGIAAPVKTPAFGPVRKP